MELNNPVSENYFKLLDYSTTDDDTVIIKSCKTKPSHLCYDSPSQNYINEFCNDENIDFQISKSVVKTTTLPTFHTLKKVAEQKTSTDPLVIQSRIQKESCRAPKTCNDNKKGNMNSAEINFQDSILFKSNNNNPILTHEPAASIQYTQSSSQNFSKSFIQSPLSSDAKHFYVDKKYPSQTYAHSIQYLRPGISASMSDTAILNYNFHQKNTFQPSLNYSTISAQKPEIYSKSLAFQNQNLKINIYQPKNFPDQWEDSWRRTGKEQTQGISNSVFTHQSIPFINGGAKIQEQKQYLKKSLEMQQESQNFNEIMFSIYQSKKLNAFGRKIVQNQQINFSNKKKSNQKPMILQKENLSVQQSKQFSNARKIIQKPNFTVENLMKPSKPTVQNFCYKSRNLQYSKSLDLAIQEEHVNSFADKLMRETDDVQLNAHSNVPVYSGISTLPQPYYNPDMPTVNQQIGFFYNYPILPISHSNDQNENSHQSIQYPHCAKSLSLAQEHKQDYDAQGITFHTAHTQKFPASEAGNTDSSTTSDIISQDYKSSITSINDLNKIDCSDFINNSFRDNSLLQVSNPDSNNNFSLPMTPINTPKQKISTHSQDEVIKRQANCYDKPAEDKIANKCQLHQNKNSLKRRVKDDIQSEKINAKNCGNKRSRKNVCKTSNIDHSFPPSYLSHGKTKGMLGLRKEQKQIKNIDFPVIDCYDCGILSETQSCIHIERRRINKPNPSSKHNMGLRKRFLEIPQDVLKIELPLNCKSEKFCTDVDTNKLLLCTTESSQERLTPKLSVPSNVLTPDSTKEDQFVYEPSLDIGSVMPVFHFPLKKLPCDSMSIEEKLDVSPVLIPKKSKTKNNYKLRNKYKKSKLSSERENDIVSPKNLKKKKMVKKEKKRNKHVYKLRLRKPPTPKLKLKTSTYFTRVIFKDHYSPKEFLDPFHQEASLMTAKLLECIELGALIPIIIKAKTIEPNK